VSALPVANAARFARVARRTVLVRRVLVVLLVALVVAAAAAARHPSVHAPSALPVRSGDMIVLDLSASISSDTFSRIGETLRKLVATGGRYGLVLFSDVAYEALPPGTPSANLLPYARYFTLPPAPNGFLPQFPTNPWTNSFSGGTRIASGLALALRLIQDQHVRHPGVILVSDLDDDAGDIKTLAGVALAYRQANIPVRVVALNPQPKDQQLFERLLEQAATVEHGRLPGERVKTTGPRIPPLLAALVAATALALAVNELWGARLVWGRA
jgi:hypothetical protein